MEGIIISEAIPTQEEIDNTTKKLRNNRSPGEDNIISEMIKYSGPSMKNEIYKLITQTWNEEKIPDNWKIGIICLIHEKGDKTECSNYRRITLLNVMYKILTRLINKRIGEITENVLGEYQCGFRSNRSTTELLFIMR
jgi:hypothetical protein